MQLRHSRSIAKTILASGLSLAILLASPGVFSTQAFAAVVTGARSSGSGAAGASAAGAALTGQLSGMGGLSLTLPVSPSLGISPSIVQPLGLAAQTAAAAVAVRTQGVGSVSAALPSAARMPAAQSAAGLPAAAPVFSGRVQAQRASVDAGAAAKAQTPAAAAARGLAPILTGVLQRFRPEIRKDAAASAAASRRAFDGDSRPGADTPAVAGKISARASGLKAAAQSAEAPARSFEPAAPKPIYKYRTPWYRTQAFRIAAPVGVLAGAGLAVAFFPQFLTAAIVTAGLMGSVLAHEFAHLAALRYFGEPTAREHGFSTLNPLKLVDPIGTLALPALSAALTLPFLGLPIVFGWAKPVPVDFNLLKDPKRDSGWIALAGPAMNLGLAGLFGLAALGLPALGVTGAVVAAASMLALMNVALFAVNMVPLPWLDGFKVFVGFLMPQSWYKKWIYNPRIATPYQKLFQRIYQGPSNVLSRFNINTMEQIGGLTRALSIAVMGVASAALWMGLGVPFLFLALPCSYDYYCIREKVRSEQAVEDMMGLMSEWGSLMVQLAEDHNAESEVSAYEAEHAMKNAVDQLLEDMMSKQSFRDLSDEEKIAEFMRVYPDMAVKFLQQRVFTKDSEEKIREILADERNKPMFDRVGEWLRKWEVFKKMSSPTEKKKLKDADRDAQEKRSREAGGPLSGFAALFAFGAASMPAAVSGPFEALLAWIASLGIGAAFLLMGSVSGNGGTEHRADIVVAQNAQSDTRFWVRFAAGVTEAQARQALDRLGLTPEVIQPIGRPAAVGEDAGEPSQQVRINMTDASAVAAMALRLRSDSLVAKIILSPAAKLLFDSGDEAAPVQRELFVSEQASLARVQQDQAIEEPELLEITLNRNLERVDANNFLLAGELVGAQSKFWVDDRNLRVMAFSAQQAAVIAAELAADQRVARIGVHSSVAQALHDARREQITAAAGVATAGDPGDEHAAGSGSANSDDAGLDAALAESERQAADTPSGDAQPPANVRAEASAPAADASYPIDKMTLATNNFSAPRGRFWVHFNRSVTSPAAEAIARRLGARVRNVTPHQLGRLFVSLEIDANDAASAARLAYRFAAEGQVEKVAVHRDAADVLRLQQRQAARQQGAADTEAPDAATFGAGVFEAGAPAPDELPADLAAKIKSGSNSSLAVSGRRTDQYWAYVTINEPSWQARQILNKKGVKHVNDTPDKRSFDTDSTEGTGSDAMTTVRVLTDSAEDLEALVRNLAGEIAVKSIRAYPAVAEKINRKASDRVVVALDRSKIGVNGDSTGRLQVVVIFDAAAQSFIEENRQPGVPLVVEQGMGRFTFTVNSVADAAELAARHSNDGRVLSVTVHPDVNAHLQAQERLAEQDNPLAKVSPDSVLPDRKDIAINFKESSSQKVREEFLNDHALTRVARYRWDAGVLIVHVREMRDAAAILQAAAVNSHVASIRMNPNGVESVEALTFSDPQAFEFGPETVAPGAAKGVDETRGVLVRFNAAPGDYAQSLADAYGLRLVEVDYRGEANAVLYEMPVVADTAFFMGTLRQALAQSDRVAALIPMREPAASADSTGAELAEALAPAAPAGPVEVAKRDPHAEFIKFLQEATLTDGKSHFTPKQVELLTGFLKPVQPPPSQKRHPVIGRVDEMKRAVRTLTGPRGRITSVMLTGPAGSGKTAIFEGLAQLMEDAEHAQALRIANNDGSSEFLDIKRLKGRWFIQLDIDRLLAEEDPVPLLLAIMDLLPLLNSEDPRDGNKVILMLDETQKLRLDPKGVKIMNALKGPIREGRVAVAGTTTDDEWKQYFETDAALESRFRRIPVAEATPQETLEMLRGAKVDFEWRHSAKIDDAALEATANLTHEYWKDKANPRKSFDYVLPDAAERSNPDVIRSEIALDIREGWRRLVGAVREAGRELADKGIASSIALPSETYNRVAGMVKDILGWYEERNAVQDGPGHVTVQTVKRTIAELTGIEAGQLTMDSEDVGKYVKMEETLRETVVNQEPALLAVARAIRRNKSGLGDPTKPMGKFLFVGPTGVGKTHIVKQLAKFLFGDEEAFIRFDMSEFMEEHTYMRLTGAPPSFVGFEEGGQLTEAVRKRPYTVILFDEIEKAHEKVWNIFLQILDDGRLTDGKGRTVDFTNTVIIFTSNIGMELVNSEAYAARISEFEAKLAQTEAKIKASPVTGLGDLINEADRLKAEIADTEAAWDNEIAKAIGESIKARMKPELINRLDPDPTSKNKWVTFNRLNRENAHLITKIELNKFKKLLMTRHDTELQVSDEVRHYLAEYGFSPIYGARPLKETIEKFIIDPLAEWTLAEKAAGREVKGMRIVVTLDGTKINFSAQDRPKVAVERSELEGAANAMTERLMELVEGLAKADIGGDPSLAPAIPTEALLDRWLAEIRKPKVEAPVTAPSGPAPVFNPNRAADSSAGTRTQGEHNDAELADKTLRQAIKAVADQAKAKGYSAAALDVLSGESFAKQFVRWAKTQSGLRASPVSLSAFVGDETLRVVVESSHKMTPDEEQHLSVHFSGKPPASLREAQQQVDRINLTGNKVRDHNLLDLYRRASAVPGARIGYAKTASGTQYWMEIPKNAPAAEGPKAADAKPDASRGALPAARLTPHQKAELEKAKALVGRLLDSTHEDGPAIMAASAEAWGMLSTPEDAPTVRRWLMERRWIDEKTTASTLSADADKIMAAAHFFRRHGTNDDINTVESLMRRFTDASHFKVPARTSLMRALSALYERAGAERARQAYDKEGQDSKVKEAAQLALAKIGTLIDSERVKGNPAAELELAARWDPVRLRKFYDEHWPKVSNDGRSTDFSKWTSLSTDAKKLLLGLVARGTERPEHDLFVLHQLLNGKETDRVVSYSVAEATAEIAARLNMSRALAGQLSELLGKHTMTGYDGKWKVLLAYLYTAQRVGGPDVLPLIEDIMKREPGSMSTEYEQPYFETPMTWAKVVVRNGLFAAMTAPQRGPNGEAKPSKLQEFLTSKSPMKVAAALYAIAYERSRLGGGAAEPDLTPIEPTAKVNELPDLYIAGSEGRPNGGFGHGGWMGMGLAGFSSGDAQEERHLPSRWGPGIPLAGFGVLAAGPSAWAGGSLLVQPAAPTFDLD